MSYCTNCGAEIASEGQKFCEKCGTSVTVTESGELKSNRERSAALIECPACKSEVSKHARKCPHCGHPLFEEKISKVESIFSNKLIDGAIVFIVMRILSPSGSNGYALLTDIIALLFCTAHFSQVSAEGLRFIGVPDRKMRSRILVAIYAFALTGSLTMLGVAGLFPDFPDERKSISILAWLVAFSAACYLLARRLSEERKARKNEFLTEEPSVNFDWLAILFSLSILTLVLVAI